LNHLFVIGVGRSGTTLLQSMLNAHSDVAFTPETHFLYHYLSPLNRNVPPSNPEELLSQIGKDPSLNRLKLDFPSIALKLKYDRDIWVHFFHEYLRAYAKKEKVGNIGDKDPMNSGLLTVIKQHFPDAWIVHIIREPRDVLLSRLKSAWGKKYPLLAHLGDHKVSLEKALREGPELFGEKYLETRYEDLIADPENEMKRICRELPIEFEEGMLNFEKSSSQLVSREEQQWKGNIFGKIMHGNTNKWKKGLTAFQKNLSGLILGDLIEKLGYELPAKVPFWMNSLKILFLPIEAYFKRKYRIRA
jgi:hypothetical protein